MNFQNIYSEVHLPEYCFVNNATVYLNKGQKWQMYLKEYNTFLTVFGQVNYHVKIVK